MFAPLCYNFAPTQRGAKILQGGEKQIARFVRSFKYFASPLTKIYSQPLMEVQKILLNFVIHFCVKFSQDVIFGKCESVFLSFVKLSRQKHEFVKFTEMQTSALFQKWNGFMLKMNDLPPF